MNYARVDFGDTPVPPELREAWQGQIVETESGYGWSLAGHHKEGVCVTAPAGCFKPLTEGEEGIARLLAETFWRRTSYTEDPAVLRRLLEAIGC